MTARVRGGIRNCNKTRGIKVGKHKIESEAGDNSKQRLPIILPPSSPSSVCSLRLLLVLSPFLALQRS